MRNKQALLLKFNNTDLASHFVNVCIISEALEDPVDHLHGNAVLPDSEHEQDFMCVIPISKKTKKKTEKLLQEVIGT